MIRLYSSIKPLLHVIIFKIAEKSWIGSEFLKFLRFLVYSVGVFFPNQVLAVVCFILVDLC